MKLSEKEFQKLPEHLQIYFEEVGVVIENNHPT